MDIESNSRFQFTAAAIVELPDGTTVETLGPWVRPSFLKNRPADEDIGVYQVRADQEGRPDRIASALYGTFALDWVLIAFNGATDVLGWPEPGTIIEYPSAQVVFSEID